MGGLFPQRRGTNLLCLVHCGPQNYLTEGVGGLLNLSKFFIHAMAIKICNNKLQKTWAFDFLQRFIFTL